MSAQVQELEVRFRLVQDADDWPPFAVESLWCTPIGDNIYQVGNVPYFVKDIRYRDKIKVTYDKGVAWFESVLEPSDYSTVHVFCFDPKKAQSLLKWAKKNGCIFEVAYKANYFAIGIPPSISRKAWMKKFKALESLEDDGFEFEIAAG
ncbi:hypothetical protein GmRootV59_02360 [Variovorax sp. V59]|uniref:DUF4265 domain-containing protein n=1 Tax=unclassified Variovorax TaxID=663243 RepID=UPI0034E875CC